MSAKRPGFTRLAFAQPRVEGSSPFAGSIHNSALDTPGFAGRTSQRFCHHISIKSFGRSYQSFFQGRKIVLEIGLSALTA